MGKVKELKICKCGHFRIEHIEKPNSKLSYPTECQKCKCSEYMNRKLPNKFSLGLMIYGFFMIGLAILASIMIYTASINIWHEPVKIPTGVLVTIIICMFGIAIVICYVNLIADYFTEKKRKNYPIDDEKEVI